jgi:hypothetical protein
MLRRRDYRKKNNDSQAVPLAYWKLNGNDFDEISQKNPSEIGISYTHANSNFVPDPLNQGVQCIKVTSASISCPLQYLRYKNSVEVQSLWRWNGFNSTYPPPISEWGDVIKGGRLVFMFNPQENISPGSILWMDHTTNNISYRGWFGCWGSSNNDNLFFKFIHAHSSYENPNFYETEKSGQNLMASGYITRYQWYICQLDLRNIPNGKAVRFKIIDTTSLNVVIDTGIYTDNLVDSLPLATPLVIGGSWNNNYATALFKEVKLFQAEDLNDFLM